MPSAATITDARRQELLAEARDGGEDAFARLIEPCRRELHAHCYRMLGTVHDAEDALQDGLLRAWRGIGKLEDPAALRAWLYRICTNTCLDIIGKRPKRVLPVDHVDPTDPNSDFGAPIIESVWVDPYPDETLEVEDGYLGPEARYEQREGVELAFVAALQHLPARQRAVLVMREVLGFSANETAESLESTTASVNSALQRARKTVEEKLPEATQQQNARQVGDSKMREIVERYVEAMQNEDVNAVVEMLTAEAAWSMPPQATWYQRSDIPLFLEMGPLNGEWRWKRLITSASGQPAVAAYIWDDAAGTHLPFALDVIRFDGERIADITSFIVRATDSTEAEYYIRWPDQPVDPERVATIFTRFGLPETLD
jgi:RNA polymerase sigma-70 factor (ECF subfamily)